MNASEAQAVPLTPSEVQAEAPRPPGDQSHTLTGLVVRGSFWTFVAYGIGQLIRLASNIILTHWLVPEFFGIMSLLMAFHQGLHMFSDLGIGPCVIQNKRGDNPSFLRTAWTIQFIRGFIIWLISIPIAWPAALFFGEPQLAVLLPIVCLTSIIMGATSTTLYSLNRHLAMGKLNAIDLASQIIGTALMLEWAYTYRTITSLMVSLFVSTTFRMVLSHLVVRGPRMHFEWSREAAYAIRHFGKWIFLSSVLGFIVLRADRFILGGWFMLGADGRTDMGALGVYAIAFNLALLSSQIVLLLSNKVLMPAYARIAHHAPERLRSRTCRVRLGLMAVTLPPIWLLVVIGPEVVNLLYDERYRAAGWMVQYLAVGAAVAAVLYPVGSVLLAMGDSFRNLMLLVARSTCLVIAMAVGGYLRGAPGAIGGLAIYDLLNYPFLAAMVRKYNVWLPALDLGALAVSALAIGAGLWAKAYIYAAWLAAP